MVSGCAAAASGGYTNVLIMPNTVPAMDGEKRSRRGSPAPTRCWPPDTTASSTSCSTTRPTTASRCRWPTTLCVCASKDRAGKEPTELADIAWYMPGRHTGEKDAAQLAHPVTAVSDDGSAVPDAILDEVLTRHQGRGAVPDRALRAPRHRLHQRGAGLPAGSACQASRRTPSCGSWRATSRPPARTGAHVHFQHVSTAGSFEAIRKAKAEGLPITCETAPHYIALTDEAILEYGPLAKMNPPLRSAADRQAVHAAIADGTVDLIATDHAPHTMEEKNAGLEGRAQRHHRPGMRPTGVCHKVLVDGGHHLRAAAHRADGPPRRCT